MQFVEECLMQLHKDQTPYKYFNVVCIKYMELRDLLHQRYGTQRFIAHQRYHMIYCIKDTELKGLIM